MSRLFIFFLFLSGAFAVQAQERVASPAASLEKTDVIKPDPLTFHESEYDFGDIPQGRPVTHTFTFKNTGEQPVVLKDVHASCGCTTPEWSKDPIPPGGSASVKVGFNAAADGPFVKPIFITYNDGESKQLIIKGNVWETPLYSAPQNNLVNQFKKKQ